MQKIVFFLVFFVSTHLLANANQVKNLSKKKFATKSYSQEILQDSEVTSKKGNELVSMIKGFQMVIKNEADENKKIDFILSQNSAYLALARIARMSPQMTEVQKKNEKTSLERVLKNSEVIIKAKNSKKEQKAKAYYHQGIASSYQGASDLANSQFLKSLETFPTSAWAPAVSIYIAENYFDIEKYEEAIRQYKVYYSKYSLDQKALATYKMAWAYMNLNRFNDSENYFLYLIDKKWSKSFGEDSLKDLAYVVTLHREEADIIQYAKKSFGQNKERLADFLTYAFKYFYQQSSVRKKPLLLDAILTIETRPAKKMSVLILSLKSQQREYASIEPFKEFRRIKVVIFESKLKFDTPEFKENSAEFELEVLALIKSYVDTFSGKTKTPENLFKDTISSYLYEFLEFHNQFFPQSPERVKTLTVWLDLCSELKNYECSYNVSQIVMKDPIMSALKEKAFKDYIIALDNLVKKKPELRSELINELKKYCEKGEDQPDFLSYSKKLTVMLNEEKDFKQSIPWLERIYKKELKTESLFRLQWTRFQATQFQNVVNEKFNSKNPDKFIKDTMDLVRESHLKLAEAGIKNNSFETYEKNISAFLLTQPEPKKADAALLDYLQKLSTKKDHKKVSEELLKLSLEKRIGPQFFDLTEKSVIFHIMSGQFDSAQNLMKNYKTVPTAQLDFHWYSSQLGLKQSLSPEERVAIFKTSDKNRQIFLGYLSIFNPQVIIDMQGQTLANDLFMKKTVLFAHQVHQKKWNVELDKKSLQIIGNIVPVELRNLEMTKTEKKLANLVYPNLQAKVNVVTQQIQVVAETVRSSRKLILKDLESRLPEVQLRILDTAIQAEEKTGKTIEMSPSPDGLNPDQLVEYQNGIAELAKEFVNQAEEYKKIKTNIEQQIQLAEVPSINLVKVDLLEAKDAVINQSVRNLLSAQNYVGAMIALDFWRSQNETEKDSYYKLRTLILLKYQPSQFMMNYVLAELKQAEQNQIIADLQEGKK